MRYFNLLVICRSSLDDKGQSERDHCQPSSGHSEQEQSTRNEDPSFAREIQIVRAAREEFKELISETGILGLAEASLFIKGAHWGDENPPASSTSTYAWAAAQVEFCENLMREVPGPMDALLKITLQCAFSMGATWSAKNPMP